MSNFRAGTRPGERKAKAISGAMDADLDALFSTKIPRCRIHWRLRDNGTGSVVVGCDGCEAEQTALVAIAQRRDRVPRTLRRKSRAWKEAGGGTEQFDLAEYDRLMEAR